MSFSSKKTSLSDVASAVWNAARSSYVTAGSMGEAMRAILDADVGTLAPVALSIADQVDRIAGKAVSVTDTASSIAQKVRGMTDAQTVAQTSLSITDQSARVSTAASITTTETPPASSLSIYSVACEANPSNIETFQISANSGTNYYDPNLNLTPPSVLRETILGSAAWTFALGANGRFRWTTGATAGTYTVLILGASVS